MIHRIIPINILEFNFVTKIFYPTMNNNFFNKLTFKFNQSLGIFTNQLKAITCNKILLYSHIFYCFLTDHYTLDLDK